jgi:hypothetical protein
MLLGSLQRRSDYVRDAAQEALHELYPREFASPYLDD